MRIVDDQFEQLIKALTNINKEIQINKTEIGKNRSEIDSLASKLNDKAPKEGAIAVVGTLDGVPATLEGLYTAGSAPRA